MNYKTQGFTEQQLQDLPKGLEVTTAEPVKKGEYSLPSIKDNWEIKGIGKDKKEVSLVGEVVQATNEKGEKQWYCPECKEVKESELEFMKSHHLRFCFGLGTKKPKKIKFAKPLLFRLEKIEEKTCPKESTTRYEDMWLKSWGLKI